MSSGNAQPRGRSKALIAVSALVIVSALALGTGLAGAVAPTVTIDPTATPSYTTAEVKGTVDPGDQETTYHFEFAIDPAAEGWTPESIPPRTIPAGAGVTAVNAELSALKPNTTYQFRLVAENFSEPAQVISPEPNPTFTTLVAGPPSVAIDPVSAVTATAAQFSGQINPNAPAGNPVAFEVNWHFECTPDCPGLSGGAVPSDSSSHTVEEIAGGLAPNTEYEVTLVGTSVGGEVRSAPETFKTAAAPPLVQTLYAGGIGATSATLAGAINPWNAPVTYQFEWGVDASYGSLTAPQPLGAEDGFSHVVTAPLTGLQQGLTYHYRVVATNTETGTISRGEDKTFAVGIGAPPLSTGCANEGLREGASAALPDCRAYEMVSPLDKNGGQVDRDAVGFVQSSISGAAVSGDAVAYPSNSTTFGEGAEAGTWAPTMQSTRGPSGWATTPIAPPVSNPGGAQAPAVLFLSEDLSQAVVKTLSQALSANYRPLAPGAEYLGSTYGLFLRQATGLPRYTLLSKPVSPLSGGDKMSVGFAAATGDMSHIVFNTVGLELLPGAGKSAVYEWTADGQLRVIASAPEKYSAYLGGQRDTEFTEAAVPGAHAISEDAQRLFYTISEVPDGGALYVWERGSAARQLGTGTFLGAKADDGSVAFFAGVGAQVGSIFRWDADAPEGSELTTIVPPDLGPFAYESLLGVAGLSDDARTLYFGSTQALAPGAIAEKPNLYIWREGVGTRLIATLDSADKSNFTTWRAGLYNTARVSAEGKLLLFASKQRLTADDNDGTQQIYLYDATLDRVVCVSCPSTGAKNTAESQLFMKSPWRGPFRLPRNLSADGTRAFFETAQSLLPGDTNGVADVYEWSDPDRDLAGALSLVSTGKDPDPAKFIDASASGNDVFFTTREQLVGFDTDHLVDAYDARVGGGFPFPPAPSDCSGEPCQGALSLAPAGLAPTSDRFVGPGNDRPRKAKARCGKGKGHRKAKAKGKSAAKAARVKRAGKCVKKKTKRTSTKRGASR